MIGEYLGNLQNEFNMEVLQLVYVLTLFPVLFNKCSLD